ncbi:MAG: hypothetical protein HC903_14230 [Methylacidiphilales bacterium]|nr:hypothetical protein [Candidatus Methylacidiphilales bacterium]NJR16998.1 hypothetical protein [Calothrix sp. CSU_2_0]
MLTDEDSAVYRTQESKLPDDLQQKSEVKQFYVWLLDCLAVPYIITICCSYKFSSLSLLVLDFTYLLTLTSYLLIPDLVFQ